MYRRLDEGRLRLDVRAVENIPRHETMTANRSYPTDQTDTTESVCPNCSSMKVRYIDIDI